MVKKLCKYEWLSFARTMLPFDGILLGLAVICRVIQLFENDSIAYSIVSVSSIVALCIAMVVGIVMVMIMAISRFYKGLYTTEGYLSFTLPVTNSQHLFSRTLVSVGFVLLTMIAVLLAGMIASLGDVLHEVFLAIGYLGKQYFELFGVHGGFYIAEAVVLVITSIAAELLLFYTCITVGQLSNKNRILAAFGVYFGYYLFTQIVGTVFVIVFTLNGEKIVLWLTRFASEHLFTFIHCAFGGLILMTVVLSVVYGLIIRWIMSHRLNLE